MRVLFPVLLLNICVSFAMSQVSTSWQTFYPHHTGDIRQYRSIYTGEITHTDYTDSIIVDPLSKDQFIFGHSVSGGSWPNEDRIDSLGNLYNMNFQSSYVRYKLYADSGQSWIGGYIGDTTRPVRVSVKYTYNLLIFGKIKSVKVYGFEAWNTLSWFWLGNDHLAEDFGLIRQDVEPSDTYVLSGAIIGGVRYGIIDGVQEKATLVQLPSSFVLEQNYPNPFNPTTTIRYALPRRIHVSLDLYNSLGEKVAHLIDGKIEAGFHEVTFNARALPSGVYFYRLSAGDYMQTKRLVLIR